MYDYVPLQGFANSHDNRKNNDKKAKNYLLQYNNEEIIQRGKTKEGEYEEFFTLPKSPKKSSSSNCHERFDIALCRQFEPSYTQSNNRSRKQITIKEKSMLKKDVEIFVISDVKKQQTIDNETPIVTKVEVQEFKAKATMY